MKHRALALVFAMFAGLSVACSDPEPAKTADDAVPTGPTKPKGGNADSDTKSAVEIDSKIVKACGDLPTANFAFDSAEVTGDAATALDALARCFVSGPLKGKGMKLIGHADPRGETEYNLGLGQKRAGSIADFLAKKGVGQGQMATSSKGEFEATGIDESGWQKDRKVEVLLAE